MSNEETFEEIDLDNKMKTSVCEGKELDESEEDSKSELTNFTSAINESTFNEISKEKTPESKYYYEFMDSNRDFFERIGFKDISSDPILNLSTEVEMNKNIINTNLCETCKKEISRIFSKNKTL